MYSQREKKKIFGLPQDVVSVHQCFNCDFSYREEALDAARMAATAQ